METPKDANQFPPLNAVAATAQGSGTAAATGNVTSDATATSGQGSQAVEASGPDLPALVVEGEFLFLRMARQLLDADLLVAGWRASAVREALACKQNGAQLVLEVGADPRGGAQVSLVAISAASAGGNERRVLDTVRERSASAAN
jgi:hypothetical protein